MALFAHRGLIGAHSRTALTIAVDTLLQSMKDSEKEEQKEENFNSKEILSTSATTEVTKSFTIHPPTMQSIADAGCIAYLCRVQTFIQEVLDEQRNNPGLYFLQKRGARYQPALNTNRRPSQMDPSMDYAGANASGWFAAEGVPKRHGAFNVAGTSSSPKGRSVLETAALEAVFLSSLNEQEKEPDEGVRSGGADGDSVELAGSLSQGKFKPADPVRLTTMTDTEGRQYVAAWQMIVKSGLTPGEERSTFLFVAIPTFEGVEHKQAVDLLPFVDVRTTTTTHEESDPEIIEKSLIVNSLVAMLQEI